MRLQCDGHCSPISDELFYPWSKTDKQMNEIIETKSKTSMKIKASLHSSNRVSAESSARRKLQKCVDNKEEN